MVWSPHSKAGWRQWLVLRHPHLTSRRVASEDLVGADRHCGPRIAGHHRLCVAWSARPHCRATHPRFGGFRRQRLAGNPNFHHQPRAHPGRHPATAALSPPPYHCRQRSSGAILRRSAGSRCCSCTHLVHHWLDSFPPDTWSRFRRGTCHRRDSQPHRRGRDPIVKRLGVSPERWSCWKVRVCSTMHRRWSCCVPPLAPPPQEFLSSILAGRFSIRSLIAVIIGGVVGTRICESARGTDPTVNTAIALAVPFLACDSSRNPRGVRAGRSRRRRLSSPDYSVRANSAATFSAFPIGKTGA